MCGWVRRSSGSGIKSSFVVPARAARALGRDPYAVLPRFGSEAQQRPLQAAEIHPITIRVFGPIRASRRSMAGFVIATQPAVGEKFFRARCRNTALPRPAIRGRVL